MRRIPSGFTLVELLLSMAIIAMLIGLATPQIKRAMTKAQSAKCLNNLRQIGISAHLYAADNNNRFPLVESMPSNEVYEADVNGINPKPLYETLAPYGLSREALKCPSDLAGPNFFAQEGSSYQWRNVVDDELASAVKIYGRRGGTRTPSSAMVVICTDYDNVHGGRGNRLYADGHVRDASTRLRR
jgi:prepilin-type N-terminal cleavage/methylation domain-containing protein/prepilin-type processing-associated H-X9-DG protein